MADTRTNGLQAVWDSAYDRKINWRLLVESRGGKLRAIRTWGIWIKHDENALWQRIVFESKPLAVSVVDVEGNRFAADSLSEASPVYVKDDLIVFNGGYLEVRDDPGLHASAAAKGVRLERFEFSRILNNPTPEADGKVISLFESGALDGVIRDNELLADMLCQSEHQELAALVAKNRDHLLAGPNRGILPFLYYGKYITASRNIGVAVDFDTEEQSGFQPLFYLHQGFTEETGGESLGDILLGEDIKVYRGHRVRTVRWRVSRGVEPSSRSYQLEGEHRVEVSQDIGWRNTPPEILHQGLAYFEYFVDGVSVQPNPGLSPNGEGPQHAFTTGPLTFKIGCKPAGVAYNEAGDDAEELITFRGKIRRLEFDPNASCGNCPTKLV